MTDSLLVEVANVQVDTLKQKCLTLRIYAVQSSLGDWWKYLLLLCNWYRGIGLLVRKKKKKKKIEEEVYKTPIERATSLLTSLEKKRALAKGRG
jgi:hypothetical protein